MTNRMASRSAGAAPARPHSAGHLGRLNALLQATTLEAPSVVGTGLGLGQHAAPRLGATAGTVLGLAAVAASDAIKSESATFCRSTTEHIDNIAFEASPLLEGEEKLQVLNSTMAKLHNLPLVASDCGRGIGTAEAPNGCQNTALLPTRASDKVAGAAASVPLGAASSAVLLPSQTTSQPQRPQQLSSSAATLAHERLRATERARAAYRAWRAGVQSAGQSNSAAPGEVSAWARVGADGLHVCGDYAHTGPPHSGAGQQAANHGADGEGHAGLGSLDGVGRAALHFVSWPHLLTHWLPRLSSVSSLTALVLTDCGLDSLSQFYAAVPYLGRLRHLTIGCEEGAPAGLHRHPMFRLCVACALPTLTSLNGQQIGRQERADAERRCAALNRAALRAAPAAAAATPATLRATLATSADETQSEAVAGGASVATGAIVSSVLQHALSVDARLRELDRVWVSALEQHVRRTASRDPNAVTAVTDSLTH